MPKLLRHHRMITGNSSETDVGRWPAPACDVTPPKVTVGDVGHVLPSDWLAREGDTSKPRLQLPCGGGSGGQARHVVGRAVCGETPSRSPMRCGWATRTTFGCQERVYGQRQETPQQREKRLTENRERMAARRRQETPQQREKRLRWCRKTATGNTASI